MIELHPALPFFIAAALTVWIPKRWRPIVQLSLPLVSLFLVFQLNPGPGAAVSLLGHEFIFFRLDALARIFLYVFLVFAFFANLYALHSEELHVHTAANAYVGSALGAVLAGDLVTLFIFWEIMAVASSVLIWNRERRASGPALARYLLIHLAGGLVFFAGIMMKTVSGASLSFGAMELDAAGWLIFAGFAVNAAIPPLHTWLPDAYPEGTPWGSVYLTAFTTKTAVYVFARAFPGCPWLVCLGSLATIYGVVFALMENDIRRLLSYHIVSQVGYMIAGIGLSAAAGVSAGTAHAACHILYKGLLFMSAGAVLYGTGLSKLSDLGGLAAKNRLLLLFFMTGALAISGMPLFNGYVSKSLLLAAADEAGKHWAERIFLLASVGTFLSITCKLGYFAFWGPRTVEMKRALPWNMQAAMAGLAGLCLLIGIYPEAVIRFLPHPTHVHVYSFRHVLETLVLLGATLAAFLLMRSRLHAKAAITLDVDWVYRKGARWLVDGFCNPLREGQESAQAGWTGWIQNLNSFWVRVFGPQGISAVGYPLVLVAGTAFAAGMLLLAFYGIR